MRSAAQHSLADMPTSQPAAVTCYTANNQQQGAVHLERCRAVGLLWDSLAWFQWLHPTRPGQVISTGQYTVSTACTGRG